MNSLALAFTVASMLGAPDTGDTRAIAGATAMACQGDESCIIDALVYVKYESSFKINPRPWSADAKAKKSCGAFQVPCWLRGLDEQARTWVKLRELSLDRCGDLTELASGVCGRAQKLVEARAGEAWLVRYALHRDELP